MKSFYGFSVQMGEGRDAVRGGRPTMDSFREWLLLAEARKAADIAREILGGESLLNQVQGILPTKVPTKLQGKIVALAAFYYADMRVKDLESLKTDIADYAKLVNDGKMPVLSVGDDLKVDNPHMSSHLGWSEVVHAKVHERQARSSPPPQGDVSDQELMAQSTDGKIKGYQANSANQCIILGQGESFCISKPGNTMFQSYRDDQTSTFYFVYDNTRTDDLARVVVDATDGRGVLLTDRKNDTGKSIQDPFKSEPYRMHADPVQYFRYLEGKGVDTSVFKNIPKSPEEEAEQAKLGKRNPDKRWFVSLSAEEKSKYIGRGHQLSDGQFEFIWDNKIGNLLAQYARLGSKATSYQFDKMASDSDLRKTYLRARFIASRSGGRWLWMSDREYGLLSKEQKEGYLEPGVDNRLPKALVVGNLEVVKELIHDDEEMDRWPLTDGPLDVAIASGNFEVIEYLVDNVVGEFLGEENVEEAALSGSVEVFKYLVGKLPEGVDMVNLMKNCAESAAGGGNVEVLRHLLDEEKADSDVDDLALRVCKSGDVKTLRYLVDEKGAGNLRRLAADTLAAGHLDAVRYLVDEKKSSISEFNAQEAIIDHAKKGRLDFIEYLVGEKGYRVLPSYLEKATPEVREYLSQMMRAGS